MLAKKISKRDAEDQPLLQREEPTFLDQISQDSFMTDNTDDSHFNENSYAILPRWNKQRLKYVYMLDSSAYTKWWDLFDVFANLMFVSSYIVLTVFSVGKRETEFAPPPPPQIYQDIDFVISVVLFVQWAPRLYFTLHPLQELKSTFAISTILTCISEFWVYFNFSKLEGTFLEGGNVVFLFPFRFIRLHRSISTCFPVGKKGFFQVSSVKQKAVNLALSIFTTLAAVTAWVHICLYKVQKYYDITFFDIFYTISGIMFLRSEFYIWFKHANSS
jgi:hypothetical protein